LQDETVRKGVLKSGHIGGEEASRQKEVKECHIFLTQVNSTPSRQGRVERNGRILGIVEGRKETRENKKRGLEKRRGGIVVRFAGKTKTRAPQVK